MWPNSKETADSVTFTDKKSLMENFIFYALFIDFEKNYYNLRFN